jgi:ubiquinone/menaquinone biosynthesis C-methylase UbiE
MSGTSLDSSFRRHYGSGVEKDRLLKGGPRLEFYRTKQILSRYLPKRPAVILDIGGATGIYSRWLAELGYSVHLVDVFPPHIRQARRLDKDSPHPLASIRVGDARRLRFDDESMDVVLLFGPMFHLVRKQERMTALSEARRVLKPRGLLFATAITRFASAMDGVRRGFIQDPVFMKIVQRDLETGQHRNPTGKLEYFTTSFFHHPDELEVEVQEGKFRSVRVYAVESFLWLLPDRGRIWLDSKFRTRVMKILEKVELEPSLKGLGDHLLAVGRK